MRADFEFLSDVASSFFGRTRIQKGLRLIDEREISGWEVWLQVELAYYLSEHESELEWWREIPVEFDWRKEKNKMFLRPDFIIRKKRWTQESYAAVELKQHPDSGQCINNMMSDITKVQRARRSELDIRSFWALGLFRREPKGETRSKIEERADSFGVDVAPDRMLVRFVPNTRYSYAIF